jgi:hypothetical protein
MRNEPSQSQERAAPNHMEQGEVDRLEAPLRTEDVWLIRTKLQVEKRTRDLAMFQSGHSESCQERTDAPQQRSRLPGIRTEPGTGAHHSSQSPYPFSSGLGSAVAPRLMNPVPLWQGVHNRRHHKPCQSGPAGPLFSQWSEARANLL